jgi:hypothetical protein
MAPGNFYGGKQGPKEGDLCAGAEGPLEHDHFFTADGAFGSHDQNGEEVDSGDFELVDRDTVSFPSSARGAGPRESRRARSAAFEFVGPHRATACSRKLRSRRAMPES